MKTNIRFSIVFTALLVFSCIGGAQETRPASSTASPKPIPYGRLKELLDAPGSRVLLLDVRTREEFDQGHIPGSLLMPFDTIQANFKETEKSRPIVVYCRSGNRSSIASRTLVGMGYTDVSDFGAVQLWKGTLER
jgi:phage shock protein E